ncbi:MAG: tRNA (adenosine(37)-N6)-threonylcarbamoyltransferase complex transferase subunit TsaD, partial [Buchnera aphidicola]|nr:tRNA (adenosine(37)-N6)-threonylcarbamoyltransferase complex transferase subunit TsaD [Buchnera aphidicola]
IKKIFIKKKFMTEIDIISYTAGPGLVGSLLVGATFACSLGLILDIPVIPVNHMEAHLLSPFLHRQKIQFPFVALLVSGKHTQLIHAENIGSYKLLGNSLDDAAGEAFDKIAVLLGLKYPGGHMLSHLAKKGRKNRYYFPRPMLNHVSLHFSFSGLKTFAANIIKKSSLSVQEKADIARAFEDSVIDILLIKSRKALKMTGCKNLVIAGGVSSNNLLRTKARNMMLNDFYGNIFFAAPDLCTDNGAMIAYLGFLRHKEAVKNQLEIKVRPKWSIIDS